MKHIKQFNESSNNLNTYKILATIELTVTGDNIGEASYKADSILSSVLNQKTHSINDISEFKKNLGK